MHTMRGGEVDLAKNAWRQAKANIDHQDHASAAARESFAALLAKNPEWQELREP
jgi:hypothetical protein